MVFKLVLLALPTVKFSVEVGCPVRSRAYIVQVNSLGFGKSSRGRQCRIKGGGLQCDEGHELSSKLFRAVQRLPMLSGKIIPPPPLGLGLGMQCNPVRKGGR